MTTPPHASTETAALDTYSHVVTSVAELLIPSVASLTVMQRRGGGAGSAVVLTPDGYLLTSAHVVAGASSGTAVFASGRQSRFEVVGADALSDLAVLRVALSDLPAASLGDAENLRVGQLVVAVGSPLGFAGSVTAGVVSALGRSLPARGNRNVRLVENVIQTDAALHPGNSGGALADSAGRVVGISTAVVGPGIGQGLGMAVPINDATRRIIAALMREGRVRRALLGIAGGPRPLPPKAARAVGRDRGVEVVQVVPGSPAAHAGIRNEDIILEVDGIPIEDAGDIQRLMTADLIDKELTVRVFRGGEIITLRPVPAELED
ncbi:MAG: S1C family serine protease [Actinomycetota bacterium]